VLWDIANRESTAFAQQRNQVVFSPDGKTLASDSDDGSVQLWDVTDRARPAAMGDSLIPPGVASQTRVAFDPQGRLYAAWILWTFAIRSAADPATRASKLLVSSGSSANIVRSSLSTTLASNPTVRLVAWLEWGGIRAPR
jgi:WD40 repeat protein